MASLALASSGASTIAGADPCCEGDREEASQDNPRYWNTAYSYESGSDEACVDLTTRYSGSYDVGDEYAHKFYNSGTSAVRRDGEKHDGILEDYAIVDNLDERDDIVSSVDDGKSKWLNAASPEDESSSDPITDAAETAIKQAASEVESTMGWAIATGEIINSLAYQNNDGPGPKNTWTSKWEYDGGPYAPVSECSNSARFWIVCDESRYGERIEIRTKQKTNIPPVNDEAYGDMPKVTQKWMPKTDDDQSDSDSNSNSSNTTSSTGSRSETNAGETVFVPGSVETYSDLFNKNGNIKDSVGKDVSVKELPGEMQKRASSDTVKKFYLPWKVTVARGDIET